jgi:ABC-type sugar transport system permease subunit
LPALTFVLVFLVYPGLSTIALSLFREPGRALTLDHYAYFFTSHGTLSALRNNAIWLVLLTALAVGGGLLLAVLFDRVRYEAVAKSVIFMPLAISFVGAAEGIRLIGTGSLADATREQSSGPQLHGPRDSPFRWGTGFMLDSTVRTMAGPGSFGHD